MSLYESTKNVGKFEVDKRIKNFINILKKNNDLSLVNKIIDNYFKCYRENNNISKIEIASNEKLGSEALSKIFQKFKNQIELEEKIDKSLIGGIRIKINDNTLIDGSIKRKLENLRKNLI